MRIIKRFPFISREHSLVLLRISLAFIFLAHAGVRLAHGSLGQFAQFLETRGFPYGIIWVFGITAFELAGGILLALGFFVRTTAAGFIILLIGGIIVIHAEFGWFVGEHGVGGSEYSFILIVAFLVLAASSEKTVEGI